MTTFLFAKGNEKTSLPNEFSHKAELGYHVSQFVWKLARHKNRHGREADGAIHWRSISQKLGFAFPKYGGDTTDRDWINHIWKRSNDFSIARILATLYCIFVLSKDTLEKIWLNLS